MQTHRPSCTRDQFVPKKQIAWESSRKGRGEHERGATSEDSHRQIWDRYWALGREKRFRRIKSYQEILLLKERLKSVAHSAEGGQDTRSRLNLVRGKGLQ